MVHKISLLYYNLPSGSDDNPDPENSSSSITVCVNLIN